MNSLYKNILDGHFKDIRNPKGGLINIINVDQLEEKLSEYMIKHLEATSKTPEEEDLLEECKEIGLKVDNIPRLPKTKIGRTGHALATLISENCFNLILPVLPWAIPLALDQDLPNFDGLCFDKSQNLWILEAKTSEKKETLSTLISELISEVKNQKINYLFQKAMWYQRHYADRIERISILKPFKNFYEGNRNSVNLIGFFITPHATQLLGRKFEQDLDIVVNSYRRNVDFPNIINNIEKIYKKIEENVKD